MLSRAQMQAWVDSGWTRPGAAGKINTLLLQFYTADASGIASNMQLTSYPGSSATDFKTSGNALLAIYPFYPSVFQPDQRIHYL